MCHVSMLQCNRGFRLHRIRIFHNFRFRKHRDKQGIVLSFDYCISMEFNY